MRRKLLGCLLVAFSAYGCMYGTSTYKEGPPLTDAQVKKLEPGRTTKEELLKWFGPPVAVVRQGDDNKMIVGEKVEARSFLELFSVKQELAPDDIIYYYRNVGIESSQGMFLLVISQDVRKVAKHLWILIDGRRGVVKDYITREDK